MQRMIFDGDEVSENGKMSPVASIPLYFLLKIQQERKYIKTQQYEIVFRQPYLNQLYNESHDVKRWRDREKEETMLSNEQKKMWF